MARAARIIAFGRSLLPARTLKHRRIQVQGKASGRGSNQAQQRKPHGTPETLDGALGKTVKESPHRVGSGPALQAQQRVQGLVRPRHLRVREAARSRDHSHAKCRQGVGQRNGVRAGHRPRQMGLDLPRIADLLQEGHKGGQTAKGHDGPGRLRKFDFGLAENWSY